MARKAAGQGELIHHIAGIRMRITGSGSLDMTVSSLDDVNSVALQPFVMAATNYIEPLRLTNFKSQRIKLRFSVDVIDEWFQIRKIIVLVKPVEADYPSILNT